MTDLVSAHKPSTTDDSTTVTFLNRMDLKTGSREVKFERVSAKPTEKIGSIADNQKFYQDLQQLNVILTNACNLSCSYCYEQHRKDFGRFDVEHLKKLYDFFVGCNDIKSKLFTFFGGEPLAQKDLILDFLSTYKEELDANFPKVSTSMVTNGLLLTPEFLDVYFSYKFVKLVISLDTDRADIDHRELTQDQIDQILSNIALIPAEFKNSKSVCIRCTISRETAPHLKSFVTNLHGLGVRSFVIHPLTMSLKSGFIEWDEQEWITLLSDMTELLELDNMLIQFSEGIGIRKHSNCMVGSDMLAVDASGDYSGCYFFTNQKVALADATLGNIFRDEVFVDRYSDFSTQYEQLFESEECKTCDLNNLCYQCPAGNLVTTGKMFRPDGMCKKVVTLFNLLHETITKKGFFQKNRRIREAVDKEGTSVIAKSLIHLIYTKQTGLKLSPEQYMTIDQGAPYGNLISCYLQHPNLEVAELAKKAKQEDTSASLKQLYEYMVTQANKPVFASKALVESNREIELFYLTLVHFFVLNTKGNKLESAAARMNFDD